MRDATTVLGITRERGSHQLPMTDLYRQLFNPDLYLHAYAHLYANDGAMTPGTTRETVDAMSLEKIFSLIDDLRHERFRWTPVKRIYIPKKNGKMRPLGLPTWTDKLLQDVLRMLLEAYYEPQFSDRSHGFRPGRGCHTALQEVQTVWTGTRWFIEGDIKGAFDNINHEVLLNILREHLQDNRFLRLIQYLLQAGYLEDWRYNATLSGSPQGGICSPILANIYLNKLDQFVEQVLLPHYNRGERRSNRAYGRLKMRADRSRARGKIDEARAWFKQAQQLPTFDPTDPDYRRLRYIRYADDTLLGFVGPKAEAEEIKRRLAEFLRDTLKLELSEEKTLITHAQSAAAHFLGYEIVTQQTNDKLGTQGQRTINGRIALRVPMAVVEKKTAEFMRDGKPQSRPILLHNDDFTIMSHYQAEYRGLIQYYLLAHNVSWFWKLHWAMQTSLLKTLAEKHQTRMMEMLRKYRATVQTPYGSVKCLEIMRPREGKPPLVARFGGIALHRQKKATLLDQLPRPTAALGHNELVRRLLADTCELCGSHQNCEVHHIRKLADLHSKGRKEKSLWIQVMAARRRKTLVVCRTCHTAIHAGKPPRSRTQTTGKPDTLKDVRPVWRGADGKGLS